MHVRYSVFGIRLKTKSRYSLVDRSFFAKIYLPVLKVFTPNLASFSRLSVSNLYKLRIRLNILQMLQQLVIYTSQTWLDCAAEPAQRFAMASLFFVTKFLIRVLSFFHGTLLSLNSTLSKFKFFQVWIFSSRSSVLRYHISMSSIDEVDFKAISMFCILNVEMVMNWKPPYSVWIYPYAHTCTLYNSKRKFLTINSILKLPNNIAWKSTVIFTGFWKPEANARDQSWKTCTVVTVW